MVDDNLPTLEQVETIIGKALRDNPFLCFAVGCITDQDSGGQGQIFYFPQPGGPGLGPRNLFGQDLAVGPNTQWMLASVTKTFTATAYARQMPDSADTPVSDYLPQAEIFSRMNMSSLVNYQSGLPQDNENPNVDTCNPPTPYSSSAMLNYLGTNMLDLGPANQNGEGGYGYTYSNLAFAIMGSALKAQSDSSLMDIYRKQLFDDLGMSCVLFKKMDQSNVPLGWNYDGERCRPVLADRPLFPAYNAAGGLVSTAPDMMTWLKFNMGLYIDSSNPTLASMSELLSATQTPSTTSTRDLGTTSFSLGWGWFIGQPDATGVQRLWKDGGFSGVRTFIAFLASNNPGYVPSGAGVFVLSNAMGLRYTDANNDSYDLVSYLAQHLLTIMEGQNEPRTQVHDLSTSDSDVTRHIKGHDDFQNELSKRQSN